MLLFTRTHRNSPKKLLFKRILLQKFVGTGKQKRKPVLRVPTRYPVKDL